VVVGRILSTQLRCCYDPQPSIGCDLRHGDGGHRPREFLAFRSVNVEVDGFGGRIARGGDVDERGRYNAGLEVRRAVLGDAHVDRALQQSTVLTEEFQNLITRYAWGEIWTRPGLPRDVRSLITIAMLVALGRDGELEMHLRAARNNGVTADQIKEVLLQTAVYCGVPAAHAAFRIAEKVLAENAPDTGP
jgi:4-carboxymuconolactone decarboxylase